MRELRQALIVLGSGLAAFLLLVGPINWNPSSGNNPHGDSDTSAPSEQPSDDSSSQPESCNQRASLIGAVMDRGFERSDFVVGAPAIDWSILPSTNSDRAFTSSPLTSRYEVRQFLTGSTKKSSVLDQLTNAGTWFPVQFQVPIKYDGNSYWDGQKAVVGGSQRAPVGDVWWLNVDASGCGVNPDDSLRAVCGNPGFQSLEPARRS